MWELNGDWDVWRFGVYGSGTEDMGFGGIWGLVDGVGIWDTCRPMWGMCIELSGDVGLGIYNMSGTECEL